MLRKLMLGLVAAASLSTLALAPTAASAKPWGFGGGWGGGWGYHHHHFGGGIAFVGNNSAGILSTETIGVLTLGSGFSTVTTTSGSGNGATAIFTSSALFRAAGATVNFVGAGSPLGSPTTTRLMMDFCSRNKIEPVTELFPMSKVNDAIQHLRDGKVRYRIVLQNDIN